MDVVSEPPDREHAFEAFPANARGVIRELFKRRRDVRHFDPGRELPAATLQVILEAAHAAPSVGLSQPWRFILTRDRQRRARIRDNFLACRAREADRFSGSRKERYLALKLEGIMEAPLNICVAADLREHDEATLGTIVQPDTLRASVVCAVQNLWLAARAEGVGVGWVSIVEPNVLCEEFALPTGIEPIAYLCVGYPSRSYRRPMLEEEGWKTGVPLADVLFEESWREAPR